MTISTPGPGSSPPPASAPAVYRRDRQLLVQRGTDLSQACLICAKAPTGGPIIRRLPAAKWITRKAMGAGTGSTLFWWDLIAYVLSMVWFVVDYPARRKRIVKIGFCDSHRRKYFAFRRGGWAAGMISLPLMFIALFSDRVPAALQPILFIIGVGLLVTAMFLLLTGPTLQLLSETRDGMWVKGAGEPFLKLYPPLPVAPKRPTP